MDGDDALARGHEEFARQLRRLEPAGHAIDRDTLMFRAGQRSAGRRLRLWQSLAGTTILLAASLGWLNRTTPQPLPERGLQSVFHEPPQERGLQSAESHTATGTLLRAKARAPQRFMAGEQVREEQAAPHEPPPGRAGTPWPAESRVPRMTRPPMEARVTGRAPVASVVLQGKGLAADYLELRRRVAFEGMDALPSPGWAPLPPATVQTIADWLRRPSPSRSISPSDPLDHSGAVTKGNPS